MRTQNAPKRTGPVARGAFTMLEVLVVLLVIGLLVALTAGTVVRVMDSQKKSITQVTLDKLQSQLNKQWSAYKDMFWRENPASVSGGSTAWTMTVLPLAGNDPKRARVIWVKLRMKQAFPQTFSEALNPSPLPALPAYQQALTAQGITGSSAATAPFESSACLLLALQQSVSGGGAKLEDLGVSGSIKQFSAGTGTINAFVDQWNMPLQFCRWPTLNAIPLGNSAGGNVVISAANDPGDPEGTLTVQSWQNTYRVQFMNLCHFIPQRASAAAPATSNIVVPLVASCGPDGSKAGLANFQQSLGLDTTNFSSTGTGAENDNLYSRP